MNLVIVGVSSVILISIIVSIIVYFLINKSTTTTTPTTTLSNVIKEYDYIGDTLPQGSKLLYGQGLKSKNGKYTFSAQQDGNFILYTDDRKVVWATNTFTNNYRPIFQFIDNNLKVYDNKSNEKWSLNINGLPNSGCKLILQDDGNLVIYDSVKAWWASNWNNGTLKIVNGVNNFYY